jgi:hypothetical protein
MPRLSARTASRWPAPPRPAPSRSAKKKPRPPRHPPAQTKAIDKNGKPLAGAAKNSFIKKCEKDAKA